jgi:hypothetical protein
MRKRKSSESDIKKVEENNYIGHNANDSQVPNNEYEEQEKPEEPEEQIPKKQKVEIVEIDKIEDFEDLDEGTLFRLAEHAQENDGYSEEMGIIPKMYKVIVDENGKKSYIKETQNGGKIKKSRKTGGKRKSKKAKKRTIQKTGKKSRRIGKKSKK